MEEDLKIEKFKSDIVNAINNSGLSISVMYYILSPIMAEVTQAYNQYSQQLLTKYNAEAAPQSEDTAADEVGAEGM